MKIGIMTFHWATNYGAVLQAYCLQEYLREQGHEVEIINFKPRRFDVTWANCFRRPKNIFRLSHFKLLKQKEQLINTFRDKYLNQTKRYGSSEELERLGLYYDVVISGSDQVLNPAFTLSGEGHPSPAYYIGFGRDNMKRIGYAISFGCTQYPEPAFQYATKWINNFDTVGVREKTGLDILKQLSYEKDNMVVPDPTILYGSKLFGNLGVNIPEEKENYTCVYMLRKELEVTGNVKYIDESKQPLSMESWLSTIAHASFMITNSYHGTIMALLTHVPFAVMLEVGTAAGMNDRFHTLLKQYNLLNRVVNSIDEIVKVKNSTIDWELVDATFIEHQKIGSSFLDKYI